VPGARPEAAAAPAGQGLARENLDGSSLIVRKEAAAEARPRRAGTCANIDQSAPRRIECAH
jgi:hypothetical protein